MDAGYTPFLVRIARRLTPYRPYLTSGVGLVAPVQNLSMDCIDYRCDVTDQEAISLCRLLAREHGLLLGGSSGVALFAALNLLATHPIRSLVAVLPDSGVSYLDQIYDDGFLEMHGVGLLSRADVASVLSQPRAIAI